MAHCTRPGHSGAVGLQMSAALPPSWEPPGLGGGSWHLVGGGHGGRHIARDDGRAPHMKSYLAPNADSAAVEKLSDFVCGCGCVCLKGMRVDCDR